MKNNSGNLTCIILTLIVAGALMSLPLINKRDIVAKVINVEKIQETHGDKKSTSTDVYFLVITDKGSYRINISGILATPELYGKIKTDSTYTFTLRGVHSPVFGIYSSIVSVK